MHRKLIAYVGVLVFGLSGASFAAQTEGTSDLQAELAALKAEVAQLRATQQNDWLNEQRTEQVKTLVRDVLADADTRASLAEGGMTAGYRDNFFLASDDGNFLLNFAGQVQFRYIYADANNAGGSFSPGFDGVFFTGDDVVTSDVADDNESGFTMRRVKLDFFGHVIDPNLEYRVRGAFNRNGGAFDLEDAYVKYRFADGMHVQMGQFKAPFNREELVESEHLLVMERSNVNEFFTLGYTQGIAVTAVLQDMVKLTGTVYDGREAQNVDFDQDASDIAFAGRAEVKLAGNWEQFEDFQAWSGDQMGLLVGAGIDYELAEGGQPAAGTGLNFTDFIQWTVDGSFELYPFNVHVAGFGRHVDDDFGINADQYGILAQAGVFVIPDKMDVYGRWEWLDHNGLMEDASTPLTPTVEDEIHIFTVGTNYYFTKHDSKFTFDVQYAPEGIRNGEQNAGQISQPTSDDSQFVVRAQYQLLF